VRALAYLDFSYAKHQCAAILRSPGRLALWLPYLALFALFGLQRITGQSPIETGAQPGVLEVSTFATLVAGAYLAVFGLAVGLAAAGRVAAFRSRSEALAFVNAGVPSRTVSSWIQVRKFVAAWPRWLVMLASLFVLVAPARSSPHGMAHVAGATFAGFVALTMIELPAFLASRRRFGALVGPCGWALALIGATYALLGALGPTIWSRGIELLRLDPGTWLLAVGRGNAQALVLVASVPVALGLGALLLGGDALPELYEASAQTFARRERRFYQRGRSCERARRVDVRIPAGALAILWQDWIAVQRQPVTRRLWAFGFAVWGAIGLAVAYDVRVLQDDAIASALLSIAFLVALSVSLTATVAIADDLNKPLWWLAADPLAARVAVWTFARAWRGGTSLAMMPLAAGLGTGSVPFALAGAASALVLWWALSALGVALYAAFPSRVDERGPILFLRFAGFAALLLPPAAAGGLVAGMTAVPLLAASAAGVVLVAEAFGAIAFAAWRFSENGAGIAALERSG
jgi:hypothetical protein